MTHLGQYEVLEDKPQVISSSILISPNLQLFSPFFLLPSLLKPKDGYETTMEILEGMKEGPKSSKIYHYRQEQRPDFWKDDFGPWSPSSFYALGTIQILRHQFVFGGIG